MKGGSEFHLTDQLSRLEQWSNITLFLRRTNQDCISLAQKSCQVYFLGYVLYAVRNLKRRLTGRRHWRIGGDGRVWNPRQKEQCKGRVNADERWQFHSSLVADGTVNISGGDRRFETIHINQGSILNEERNKKSFSRRIRRTPSPTPLQDDSTQVRCVKPKMDFWSIYRRFHLSPSRETQSQTVRAKTRIISYSVEVHRRHQKYTYITGCDCWRNIWMITGTVDVESELSDAWTGLHKIYFIERKTTWLIYHGPGREDWQENRRPQGQTMSGQSMWKRVSDASKRKAMQKWAIEKPKVDIARRLRGIFPSLNQVMKNWSAYHEKTLVENWKFRCQQQCHVKQQLNCRGESCRSIGTTQDGLCLYSSMPTNLWGYAWKDLISKNLWR